MGTFQSKHKYDVATGEMTIKGIGRNDRKREHVTRIAQHNEVLNKINTQPFDKEQSGNGVHSNEHTISDKQGDVIYQKCLKESHDETKSQSTTTESKAILNAQKDSVNYELQRENILSHDEEVIFKDKNKVELGDKNGRANLVPEPERKIELEPKLDAHEETELADNAECKMVEVSEPELKIEQEPKSNATNPDVREENKLADSVDYETVELSAPDLNNDSAKGLVNSHEVTHTFKLNEEYFINQAFIEEEKKTALCEVTDKPIIETIEPAFSSACEQEAITVLNEVIKEAVTKAAEEIQEPVCIINTTRRENGDADIYSVTTQSFPNATATDEICHLAKDDVDGEALEEAPTMSLMLNNENSTIFCERHTKSPTLEMHEITVISESPNESKIARKKEEVTSSLIYLESVNNDEVHYTLDKLQAMDEQIKSSKARILNVNEIN